MKIYSFKFIMDYGLIKKAQPIGYDFFFFIYPQSIMIFKKNVYKLLFFQFQAEFFYPTIAYYEILKRLSLQTIYKLSYYIREKTTHKLSYFDFF